MAEEEAHDASGMVVAGSAMRRTAIGIVGTGFAALAHLEALRRIPEIEVVAIAGSDPDRTSQLADRYGLRAYTDHRALLDDPRVHAVHNCTVNERHCEVSLDALERGKHVLTEKPLAVNSDESARLVAAAERAQRDGVLSGVCFNYRHYPLVAQIREMIQGGDYGRVHFVHGQYLQDWLLFDTDWNWRVQEAEQGGSRAVADIGSHWADLAQHVIGDRISEVFADVGTLHKTRRPPSERQGTFSGGDGSGEAVRVDSEDFGAVLVRFESGARGTFAVSQTSAGRKNGLSIQVDTASAAFAWHQEEPERAWVGRRGAPNLELVRDPATLDAAVAGLAHLPAGHPEGWCDALRNVFDDFYSAVAASRAGQPYDMRVASFRDGHERVLLVEAVMRSHREQRWTPVATTEAR